MSIHPIFAIIEANFDFRHLSVYLEGILISVDDGYVEMIADIEQVFRSDSFC